MNIQHTMKLAQTFGPRAALHDLAYRVANRGTELMVLKGIAITMADLDPKYLEEDDKRPWGFLDERTLLERIGTNHPDMSPEFVREACERGDRCYGVIDGDVIASYGWYSTRPTPVSPELMLHFDSRYAYMYKGYTLPEYRGQRLHGIGMARALRALDSEGCAGLVSYVKSNNFASLRSCYRMGYKDFGEIVAVKFHGRYFVHATKGCEKYAFRVEPTIGPTGRTSDASEKRASAET